VSRPAARTGKSGASRGPAKSRKAPVELDPAGVPGLGVVDVEALRQLPEEELIGLVEGALGGGITVAFSGKTNATRIARKVRPRITRRIKSLSVGTDEAQAANTLIEGDNLQAMATLYRERGQIDLILTDPPYNTGNDFRYNDKWETDPNDPGMGEFVGA
jgi:adenine-specific DNA-methyltransferase